METEQKSLKKYVKDLEERNHELSSLVREKTWEKQKIH